MGAGSRGYVLTVDREMALQGEYVTELVVTEADGAGGTLSYTINI